jgi:hypothetical protein
MTLEPEQKERVQQAKAAAQKPALRGKCVSLDGGMLGSATQQDNKEK